MKFSTAIRIAGLVTAFASVLTLSLVVVMTRCINHERELTHRQVECSNLGRQLADASDFLTSEVRRYTIFGEKRHLDAFNKELNETRTRDRAVNRLNELQVRPEELALIEQAKRYSDKLVTTENEAIQAVMDGDFSLAQTLMFDANYDREKMKITNAIDRFERMMNTRIETEVLAAREKASHYLLLANTVVVAYVCLVVSALIILSRTLVFPLTRITDSISNISAGDLDTEIPTHEAWAELGDLSQAAMHFRDSLSENVRLAENLQEHRDNLQEEVDKQTQRLRFKKERMRRTFESSPNGLAIEHEQRGIEAVNSQFAKLFACDKEAIHGQPLTTYIAEHCRNEYARFRESCLDASSDLQAMIELTGVRSDGTEFPLEIGLVQIDEESQDTMMATIVDVSQRKQSERAIRRKNLQLGRLNSELLEFSYSVSHDLKGPLISITGLLDFCESDLQQGDYDEVCSNIAKVQKLTKRLAGRIESTLTLAKSDLDSGQWEAISLVDRVQQAWETLPNQGIELITHFEFWDRFVTVPSRLDTILENLFSNAIKYHDPAKQKNIVQVSCWPEGDDLYLSVADNGLGIPVEHRDRVFRLFHRLGGQETDGTGLGLPWVKKNVTHLGGAIELDTKAGMTTFTIVLPMTTDLLPTQVQA